MTKQQVFSPAASAYIRFIDQRRTIEATSLPLASNERDVLEVIAIRALANTPLTITELMAMSEIASPATIHRKIDQLRELGMVDTVFEGNNRRTKYLVPTQAAHDYFDQVGKVMQQAISAT